MTTARAARTRKNRRRGRRRGCCQSMISGMTVPLSEVLPCLQFQADPIVRCLLSRPSTIADPENYRSNGCGKSAARKKKLALADVIDACFNEQHRPRYGCVVCAFVSEAKSRPSKG